MVDNLKFTFTATTPLDQLQDDYNRLLQKIDMNKPRNRIIVQAKLLTTRIDFPDIHTFDPECWEICRQIKAVTEAIEVLTSNN